MVGFVALRQTLPAEQAPCGMAGLNALNNPIVGKFHATKCLLRRQTTSQRDIVHLQRRMAIFPAF